MGQYLTFLIRWRFESVGNSCTVHVVQRSIPPKFSSNSEADASELLENLKEMFPRYLY